MKTAVISGGNGGLGRAMAAQLEREGWHTVLLDVNIDGLEASESRTPVAVDLTDTIGLRDITSQIIATRPSIDMVIYNAGVSQIGPFAVSIPESHRSVFEINYFAAVEMARFFLRPIRQSRGIHVAISSVAGFSPLHGRTAYAASKHAMQGFFTSLRSEEAQFGVRCSIVAPSFIATNMGNSQPCNNGIVRPGSARDGVDYMSPDAAAQIILRGIKRGREFIPVGRIAHLASFIMRLSPRLYQRLMRRNIGSDKQD